MVTTTAEAGVTYDWGADIGFQSAHYGCADGAGYGWFPPGPACPEGNEKTIRLPADPTPATAGEECELGLGATGWWLNGVSVYNWSDGQTYDSQGQWRNVAQVLEIFDMGPCLGHAANGDYHHHTYSDCLAEAVGDDGDGHNPVYGFAADGYPIHGPHHGGETLASSCWMMRDYDDPADLTGCGGAGERSCVLVDPMDPGAGTTAADAQGPTTSETVTSLSGNLFSGSAGLCFEDHYFSAPCAAAGGEHLDEHNGHAHDDIGYHYHVTFSFPYMPGADPLWGGDRRSGELQWNAAGRWARRWFGRWPWRRTSTQVDWGHARPSPLIAMTAACSGSDKAGVASGDTGSLS